MLIAVCVAAVCLQLPYMILYLIFSRERSWWPGEEGSAKYAWIRAWKEIAEAVSVANYAVNFFLYCVSGSAFRRQVRTISRRVCRAHRRSLLAQPSSRPVRHRTAARRRLRSDPKFVSRTSTITTTSCISPTENIYLKPNRLHASLTDGIINLLWAHRNRRATYHYTAVR